MARRGSPQETPRRPPSIVLASPGARVAIVKGQDSSRWTDFYHAVLTAPWWMFFLGLLVFFLVIKAVFALFYLVDPTWLGHARPGNFWDAFLFSVETITSVDKSDVVPSSIYANIVVVTEAFFGILTIGADHRRDVRALLAALFARAVFARWP